MQFRVEHSEDTTFENVKKITLGTGKSYFIYKDNNPFLWVEVNSFSYFFDAIIFHDYLIIGNYYEGVYFINLNNYEVRTINVKGYFGYFKLHRGILYVLGCEDIMAFDSEMNLLWKSDNLALDGIVCDCIEDDTMTISCEMDPPGGWITQKISLIDGTIIG